MYFKTILLDGRNIDSGNQNKLVGGHKSGYWSRVAIDLMVASKTVLTVK